VTHDGGAPGGAPPSSLRHTDTVSVLVADDSPLYRRILTRAVDAEPSLHLVGAVEDGDAALAAVDALAPDVLLLDLRMPGMDGLDVLERLADHELVKVLMSATLDKDVERRATELGADACIPKHRSCAEICAAALTLARR
jgi:two-component system, NarL family, nitrate/nitrite response regulator NarL